jgi:hypothetical protein
MTWHIQNLTHSTSSQEQEAAFSVISYLDTIQSELAKSNHTQETFCSQDSVTESFRTSPSGTTWQPSTEIHGAEQLTFFAEDSHAKTSLQQVKEQELQENVRDYGRNMRDSLERCGLDLSLPKTHHCFGLGDLELSSKTWPRWGIMLDGGLSELGLSVRRTSATGCGSWPTPTTMETLPPKSPKALHKEATQARPGRSRPANLRDCVHPEQMDAWNGSQIQRKYLTPQANEDAAGTPAGKMQKMLGNSEAVMGKTPREWKKGTLNPSWVEWLMGWPIGWTDLKPLATDKFRNVQLWHSTFSQKDYSETTPITNDIN